MTEDGVPQARRAVARQGVTARLVQLEQRRRVAFLSSVVRRYRDIDGGTYAGLTSIQLFTTVLPLIILGFGYFSGFARDVSVGTLFDRELGLHGSNAQTVREAFGSADGLHSSWTILGLAGFLAFGIPMTAAVAGMFARAWLRAEMPFRQRLWRGAAWFVLYLGTLAAHDQIAFGSDYSGLEQVILFCVSLLPIWVFWTVTPVLLVRDGGRGARFLAKAGLAGLVIDGVVLTLAMRLAFPFLLAGWTGFGPIGVAMVAMTWCGVIGTGWVATACTSAVLWERSAPPETVIAAETDVAPTENDVQD